MCCGGCGHALARERDDGSCALLVECPRCGEELREVDIEAHGQHPMTGEPATVGPGVSKAERPSAVDRAPGDLTIQEFRLKTRG